MKLYKISNKQFRKVCEECELGNGDFFTAMHEFHEVGSFNSNSKPNKQNNEDFYQFTFYQKELKELAKVVKGSKTAKVAFELLARASELTSKDLVEAGLAD